MNVRDINTSTAHSIDALCRKFHIQEMAVFGSAAREETKPDSDVDVFVEFEPGYHPGLGWFDLEEELEALLGARVDLSRKSLLKPRVRREALRDAVVLFGA